ncbi:MAG: NAD-dependent protein deacylase [Oscillospiraceae bacterium]|nr:NAD-dependent protein deacylase [Oscillospiraceae bacterium]
MAENDYAKLNEIIRECNHIVFFGGAGVSTESGIPDFRSKDGLYNQHDVKFDRYSPEYLLSIDCLVDHPDVFYEFYRQKLDTKDILPNRAHYKLAEMEKAGKLDGIITQNIDGLHQKAGSKTVYEIHGTTQRNYCTACGKAYDSDYIFNCEFKIPRCECGGIVRCDVTLYEESLPEEAVRGAVNAISKADMLIIGGTSLTVYPAASYIRYFRGKYMVIINKEHLSVSFGQENTLEISEPIGQVFKKLSELENAD